MYTIGIYKFLSNNKIAYIKIDKSFLLEMKEKMIKKYGSLRQYYQESHLDICYAALRFAFNKGKYFNFSRLLKIAQDINISQQEIFSHIKAFFASGSNTSRELILPPELNIDGQFIKGYALYLAEGDNGSNGKTIPRKIRFTNSNLYVINFFINKWLKKYFPSNDFYLLVILPPAIKIGYEFVDRIKKELSLDIKQIKLTNGYYNKKIKYRVCCDQALLIDLILSLKHTIKSLCLHNKEFAAAYIQGMMIGEGTVYFNKSRYVRIEMRNKEEIKFIFRLLQFLNYPCKLPSLRSNRENMWSIYIGAKQLGKFYHGISFGEHQEKQKILERAVNKQLRINQYI